MSRFLSEHGLFFLLLGGSCLGHWSLVQWQEQQTIRVEMRDREQGRTSIAVQVVAARPKSADKPVELTHELKEPVETDPEEETRIKPRDLPLAKTERPADEVVALAQPHPNAPLVPRMTTPALEQVEVDEEKPLPKNEPPQKPTPKKSADVKLPEMETIDYESPVTIVAQQSTGIDVPPKFLTRPDPEYPPNLLQARIQGSLVVMLTIGTDGLVKAARIYESSGYAEMDASALKTVRRWKFSPAMLDGNAVERDFRAAIGFSIRSSR